MSLNWTAVTAPGMSSGPTSSGPSSPTSMRSIAVPAATYRVGSSGPLGTQRMPAAPPSRSSRSISSSVVAARNETPVGVGDRDDGHAAVTQGDPRERPVVDALLDGREACFVHPAGHDHLVRAGTQALLDERRVHREVLRQHFCGCRDVPDRRRIGQHEVRARDTLQVDGTGHARGAQRLAGLGVEGRHRAVAAQHDDRRIRDGDMRGLERATRRELEGDDDRSGVASPLARSSRTVVSSAPSAPDGPARYSRWSSGSSATAVAATGMVAIDARVSRS